MSAEYLAEKLGCDLPLAAAALKVCHDAETAATVIQNGQANPLDLYEGLEAGPSHGDAVFKHPYVQCLLAVARQRVNQALEESCETGQWLICVRTFQRPGLRCQQSELHRFLQAVLHPKAATILENKLEAVNIDWPTLQKMAKKPLHAFEEAMRRAGVLRFHTKTAKKLAAKVREPLEKIEKKQHSSEKGLRELTLAALELAMGPDAYKRCLIFVSHTDDAWISGQYAAALRGTPWADRIVVGIRGAHLQVRFMEEAAPIGSHIVVMDDNIENLLVEIPDDSIIAQRKAAGINEHSSWPLKFENFLSPLMGTGLEVVEEQELIRFLRGVFPQFGKWNKNKNAQKWKQGKNEKYEDFLEDVFRRKKISSVRGLQRLTPARKKAVLKEVGLSERQQKKCLKELENPKHLPPSRLFAKRSKKRAKRGSQESELSQLISRAGHEMQKQGVHLWGVNTSRNHFFLKGAGQDMRRRALEKGIFQDYSTRLGLVYGAWFGLRVTHNPSLYTRGGQIKDDVERTLRYWHLDRKSLRFMRYGADKKSFRPGCFAGKKGGISANSSEEKHTAEAQAATLALVDEFGAYVRLPEPGEKSTCGIVWNNSNVTQTG